MNRRIIPCLTWSGGDIVKTTRFSTPEYIGDACNLVRIFSEKNVDELIFLDIDASREGRGPDLKLVADVAACCTVPLTYGGGLTSIEQISQVLYQGVEKVIIGQAAYENTDFVREAVAAFGSSTITICINYGDAGVFPSKKLYDAGNIAAAAFKLIAAGAGELILHDMELDGTGRGYNLPLLRNIVTRLPIPVVALGGAGGVDDIATLFRETGVSAAAAGYSMVYIGPCRAVLPSYPELPAALRILPSWSEPV